MKGRAFPFTTTPPPYPSPSILFTISVPRLRMVHSRVSISSRAWLNCCVSSPTFASSDASCKIKHMRRCFVKNRVSHTGYNDLFFLSLPPSRKEESTSVLPPTYLWILSLDLSIYHYYHVVIRTCLIPIAYQAISEYHSWSHWLPRLLHWFSKGLPSNVVLHSLKTRMITGICTGQTS